MRRRTRSERGLSLVESLVAIVILAITGLSLAHTMISATRYTRRAERNSIATQLAFEKMEQLAARSPATLGDAFDLTETALTVNRIAYNRTTNVTVNADGSRTVVVDVWPRDSSLGKRVTYQSTFARWGTE
jgi:prepilin-type N-terminal cleavage/methylation domain-containing protein